MINKFFYLKGGSERYVFELTKLLESRGHTVIPFSMRDQRNFKTKYDKYFIKKVDLDKFNFKNIIKFFYNYEAIHKLKKLIEEERPDLAHLHNIAHQISPAIIKILKKYNIPVVQTLHDYKLICPNYRLFSRGQVCYKCQSGKFYNCFLNKCIKNSWLKSFLVMNEAYLNNRCLKFYDKIDRFIAPSQYMRNTCLKYGIPENRIALVYNFIDAGKELINHNNADYILYYGRLSKEKGIESLIKAMTMINQNTKLKIVGQGPEFSNFRFLISRFKLNNKIELLDSKYGDELNQIIAQAKAVIVPSLWPENMPYGILEALALGKVVIASRIGGLPEIINDDENGFLFTSGDSHDLANKIKRIVNDKNLEVKIEKNIPASLIKFNKEEHYTKINQIYLELLKNDGES